MDEIKGKNWLALLFQILNDIIKHLETTSVDHEGFVVAFWLFHDPARLDKCPEIRYLGYDSLHKAHQYVD